jgi:pilus assembly protein FimV
LIHKNSLDFDTSKFFEKSTEQNQKKTGPAVSADIETIDFHTDGLSLEKTIAKNEVQNAIDSFEFNFDIDDIETTTAKPGKPDTNANLNPDQLSDTVISEPVIGSSPNELQTVEGETIGDFDFNFDFGVPVIDGKEYDEFDLSVSDLTDMDEFETKIDLAKAYVDMGDAESAKMIAEEVRMKGSKEQQAIAQSLLDELK